MRRGMFLGMAGLACAILLLSGSPGSAVAESIFAMEGIGLWQESYDLAARGMGSTAIGVPDRFGMSPVNPAGAAFAAMPQAHFGVLTQSRWIRSDARNASDRSGDTRLSGVRAVLPFPRPVRIFAGYRDLTDAGYQAEFTLNPGRPDEFSRTMRGRGGLGELSFGAAAPLSPLRLAVGAQVGFGQGRVQEFIENDFVSEDFADGRDTLRTNFRGLRTWSVGVQATPLPRLAAGFVFSGGTDLDLEGRWRSRTSAGWIRRATMEFPSGYGLGLSALATRRTRVSLDWIHRNWGESEFRAGDAAEGGGFANLRNTDRFGIGLTFLPGERHARDPLLRRSVWRAGFNWAQLPVRQWDPDTGAPGATVTEWAFTGGLGLPVQVDRGFMDLLLEVGRTGNLEKAGLRETFIRFGAGVTFGRFQSQF